MFFNPTRINRPFHVYLTILICMALVGSTLAAASLNIGQSRNLAEMGFVSPSTTSRISSYSTGSVLTHQVHMAVSPQDCQLIQTQTGTHYVTITNTKLQTIPHTPIVPTQTITTQLPHEASVLDVKVVGGRYADIQNPLQATFTDQPRVWMRTEDMSPAVQQSLQAWFNPPPPSTNQDLYPGKVIAYETGKDNHACYVTIKTFPVQMTTSTQQAALITEMILEIQYSLPMSPFSRDTTSLTVDSNECVIICPAQFVTQAQALKALHAQFENVSTSIITTETINEQYSPAPAPPYDGFRNEHPAKERLENYDYDLARRIIKYLRDHDQHPNLKYIVLFGDAAHVPPSYYINNSLRYESTYENYYDWIPTDFLYTSPDYDCRPNYRLGRLPVSDKTQATAIVTKIESWLNQTEWDWFPQANVIGGQPFGTPYYIGERSHIEPINANAYNGFELNKYFETHRNYTPNMVKPLLLEGQYGLLYHVDHGSGYELGIGHEDINAKSLFPVVPIQPNRPSRGGRTRPTNPPETPEQQTTTPQLPVVLSVACINGAYDTDIAQFEDRPEFPVINGHPTSFGQAVVLSSTGGIAYIGGARLNAAGWTLMYHHGELLAQHDYIVQYLNTVVTEYQRGARRLGDLVFESLTNYAQDNPLDERNREMLFTYVLFGDPVLTLPGIQSSPNYEKAKIIPQGSYRYTANGLVRYQDLPESGSNIRVEIQSNAPTTHLQTHYTWKNSRIAQDEYTHTDASNGINEHSFPIEDSGLYLIRAEVSDGKETWVYANAQKRFTASANILIVDSDMGRDQEKLYTQLLKSNQISYDHWETGARDTIHSGILDQYQNGTVIWLDYLDEPEIIACQNYLDRGGRLLLISSDFLRRITFYGNYESTFLSDYLRATYIDDGYRTTLSGVTYDPISNNLNFDLDSRHDIVEPNEPSIALFYLPEEVSQPESPSRPANPIRGSRGRPTPEPEPKEPETKAPPTQTTALRLDNDVYRLVYLGFELDDIDSKETQKTLLLRSLDWLAGTDQ